MIGQIQLLGIEVFSYNFYHFIGGKNAEHNGSD
jgi:hypothetical protein